MLSAILVFTYVGIPILFIYNFFVFAAVYGYRSKSNIYGIILAFVMFICLYKFKII